VSSEDLLTAPELKSKLQEVGLSFKGTRPQLLARWKTHLAKNKRKRDESNNDNEDEDEDARPAKKQRKESVKIGVDDTQSNFLQIQNFPPEVLLNCFSQFDGLELWAMMTVCRKWYALLNSKEKTVHDLWMQATNRYYKNCVNLNLISFQLKKIKSVIKSSKNDYDEDDDDENDDNVITDDSTVDYKLLFLDMYNNGACKECGNLLANYFPLIGDFLCQMQYCVKKYPVIAKSSISKTYGLTKKEIATLPHYVLSKGAYYLASDCEALACNHNKI